MTKEQAEKKAIETSALNGGRLFKAVPVTYCASGEQSWDVTPDDNYYVKFGDKLYFHDREEDGTVIATGWPTQMTADIAFEEARRLHATGKVLFAYQRGDGTREHLRGELVSSVTVGRL